MKFDNEEIKEKLSDAEFDELLDEFISAQSQDAEDIDETVVCETSFIYDGQSYDAPVSNSACGFSLQNIEVECDGCVAQNEGGRNCLFVTRKSTRALRLTFHLDWEDLLDTFLLQVRLYKKGIPSEYASMESDIETSQSFSKILVLGNELTAGSYFLYVQYAKPSKHSKWLDRVKQGVCYPFEVLLDGGKMKRPVMADCSAYWESRNKVGLWHRNPLRITASLWDFPNVDCELTVLCYNNDLSLMGQDTVFYSCDNRDRRKETFSISGNKLWLPGNYSVVMTMNRFPFERLSITLDDHGNVQCHQQPMDKEDYFFRTVRDMEFNKRPSWNIIREFSGLGKEKRKLYALYNECNHAEKKGFRRDGELLLFTAPTDFYANRVAFSMKNELGVGREQVAVLNCSEARENYQERITLFLEDRKNKVFIFFHADKLLSPNNDDLLSAIAASLLHPEDGTTIVLCFNHQTLATFRKICPEIVGLVSEQSIIHIQEHSLGECVQELVKSAEEAGLILKEETIGEIAREITRGWNTYELRSWTDYTGWLDGFVKPAICSRLRLHTYVKDQPKRVLYEDLHLEDYWKQALQRKRTTKESEEDRERFDKSMKELNNLIGLENLKKGMSDVFVKIQFNKQRAKLGLPEDCEAPKHLLFTGNPGTGKTTVAKLLGKIYKSMGLLSDGDVVVTERTQLVGSYIGQTEEKMREILESAKGKVLFIDEAYTLCDSATDRKDFGYRVIESLLTILAEPHPDMVVILAGYGDEMQRLLKANQGLKSRFSFLYEFEDYTAEQLFQIAVSHLSRFRYVLTEKARISFMKVIENAVVRKGKDFGNARWVKQLVDDCILPAMARRVMASCKPLDMDLCMRIEEEDLCAVDESLLLKEMRKERRMGFRG